MKVNQTMISGCKGLMLYSTEMLSVRTVMPLATPSKTWNKIIINEALKGIIDYMSEGEGRREVFTQQQNRNKNAGAREMGE